MLGGRQNFLVKYIYCQNTCNETEIKANFHFPNYKSIYIHGNLKKVNRKGQGMPQSQTAANPRQQEEEKKDKNIHAQNKQINVREAQRPAPSSPSEVIRMLRQTEKRRQRTREDFKPLSTPWYKPQSYIELRTTPG